jgi:L-amino acid N-acyltransferase YncA
MSAGRCPSTGRCCSLSDGLKPTAISIRAATDADLPAILEIFNHEVVASPYLYVETPLTLDDRRVWLEQHRAATLPILVATSLDDDLGILGYASLSPYRPSSGYRFSGELSVYVAPSAQRLGIGGQLLGRMCEEARALGLHAVVASIDSENAPSIALFERYGFVEAARLAEVGRKFDKWRTQLLFTRTL